MEQKSGLFSTAFAEVVKSRREAANLSRAALARSAKLHQTYIGLLERGERSPNVDTAKAISDALGITLTVLINETEQRFNSSSEKGKRKKRSV